MTLLQWEYPAELAAAADGGGVGDAGAVPAVPEALAPEAEPVLPAGWVSAIDPSSSRRYYANTVTGVTQWEPPTEAIQATAHRPVYALAATPTVAPTGKRLTPASRGGWKRLLDYSRMEATSSLAAKGKKFAGLRCVAAAAAARAREGGAGHRY